MCSKYGTIQHKAELNSTIQYNTICCKTVLRSELQIDAEQCSAMQCSVAQYNTVYASHWRSAIKKMSIVPNHQEPERSIVKNTDINNIQSVNNFKYSIVIDNQSSQYAIGYRFVHIESYNTIPARATSLLCPSLVARRYTAERQPLRLRMSSNLVKGW